MLVWIEEVLPLAKPITSSGVKLDSEKLKARNDAQAKAVMTKGGFGLIVLGGSHDLSDSVRWLGEGKCAYIRMTTRRFKELSGKTARRSAGEPQVTPGTPDGGSGERWPRSACSWPAMLSLSSSSAATTTRAIMFGRSVAF